MKLRLVFVAALGLWLVPAAHATTYVVNKTGDPSPGACTKSHCTLREAVRAANAHPGADKIVLPGKGPYNLTRTSTGEDGALDGDLDITNDPLRIEHRGKGRATINGHDKDRIFDIFVGAPTTLVRLKLTEGDNASNDDAMGGAIHTYANLRIVNCALVKNRARGSNGSGGAIHAADGKLTILRSTISHNIADDSSGALDIDNHGVTIKDSTIVGNRASFAGVSYMYGDGHSRIERTTMAGNRSTSETGAIYFSETSGTLTIVGSTISGNHAATDGGGLTTRNGTTTITNSTIANNTAGGSGGGIYAGAELKLNAVTVVRNVANLEDGGHDGGGIQKITSGFVVEVKNSLIALNKLADGQGSDCHGELTSLGHNLISTTGPSNSCAGITATGDLVRSNPKLGLLKMNGGPTKTVALLKGSPALNHAAKATAPKRDQRGVKRGKKPDIGAYERRAG